MDIEYLQDEEFPRNYNSPRIDLTVLILVQVHPFGPLVVGVPLSVVISSLGEGAGDISTPNSCLMAHVVSPSPVTSPRTRISIALVVSLNFKWESG